MNRYHQRVRELNGETIGSGAQFTHLSEDQLKEVESLISFPLPADYREFLSDFGGITFLRGAAFTYKGGDNSYGSVDLFYGVDPENLSEGILSEYNMWCHSFVRWTIELIPGVRLIRPVKQDEMEVPWPRELLPIGMDAGDNQICLALGGLNTGAVFFWNNTPSFGDQNVYLIARSFDEFMNLLYLRN